MFCIWPLIFLGFCGCNGGHNRRCRRRCVNDPFRSSRCRFDPDDRPREFDPDDRDDDRRRREFDRDDRDDDRRRRGCGCRD